MIVMLIMINSYNTTNVEKVRELHFFIPIKMSKFTILRELHFFIPIKMSKFVVLRELHFLG